MSSTSARPRLAFTVVTLLAIAVSIAWTEASAAGKRLADEQNERAVRDAIGRMVVSHLGAPADVAIQLLNIELPADAGEISATPATGARTGKAVRFTLHAGGKAIGYAVARVDVKVAQAIALKPILRGESIAEGDFQWIEKPLVDQPFERLPRRVELAGASPRRGIVPMESLTFRNVLVPPVVKSGDRVTATVRLEGIEVAGEVVASGSGHVGDMIRVVTPRSRTGRLARITAPGEVEIVP